MNDRYRKKKNSKNRFDVNSIELDGRKFMEILNENIRRMSEQLTQERNQIYDKDCYFCSKRTIGTNPKDVTSTIYCKYYHKKCEKCHDEGGECPYYMSNLDVYLLIRYLVKAQSEDTDTTFMFSDKKNAKKFFEIGKLLMNEGEKYLKNCEKSEEKEEK